MSSHTFYQRHQSEHRWTKDHLLEPIRGNPSKPAQTKRKLVIDLEMCMFTLTVSTAEPKNIKEEEIYAAQLDGFVDPDHPEKVYRLRNALYGLKQAPRSWYDELLNFLMSKGFTKVTIDPSLFTIRYRETRHSVSSMLLCTLSSKTNRKAPQRDADHVGCLDTPKALLEQYNS
nr:Gag-Pol polyprotein [Tanacetum cinerariifolium]